MTPELIGAYTAAAVAIISAVATAVVTVLKGRESKTRDAGVSAQVHEVHQAVNGTQAALLGRVDQLTAALTAAGVDVPIVPPKA